MQRTLTLLVLVTLACSQKNEGKVSGEPGPKPTAAPAPAPASARPAAITDEMNATFDAYVTAFEKLTSELAAAAPDCAKAVAVVERNARALDALDARGAALTEKMVAAKGDPAAGEWFGNTYGPRMKAAADKMKPLVESCESNSALKTAMNDIMSRFPMMRRKH